MTTEPTYIVMTATEDGVDWLAESPSLEAMVYARDSWLAQANRAPEDRAWIQPTTFGMLAPKGSPDPQITPFPV